jgi:hypothetical protein
MDHGPVPMEIYENRENTTYFKKVVFEPKLTNSGNTVYFVKPNGKFDPDYFSLAELEEMSNLIEMFAQKWLRTSEISDASHHEIKSWKKTYSREPNSNIDPIEEFDRDIMSTPEEILHTAELKFLMHRKMLELQYDRG